MVKCIIKLTAGMCFVSILYACSSANNKPLLIGFSVDSTTIIFDQIDQAGLLQLKNASFGDSVLNDLVSVLQTPSETDTALKEMPVDGQVIVTDSNVVFKPVKPFVKGRDYLVITHLNARFGTTEKLLKGELNGVKPLQKLLAR